MKRAFAITTILLVALTGSGLLLAQAPRSANVQFKAAQHKEEVEGDLKGAIEQYQKIAQSSDRALAAKALVQMGRAYEKLGDAEAQKAYDRVAREFADQVEAAAEARIRLAALSKPVASPTGIVTRQVWTGYSAGYYGSVSPDERFLSFVDIGTGDLAVRDLANGKERRLTDNGTRLNSGKSASYNVISPDGKQVAYSWLNKDSRNDLRVIGLSGSTPTPRVLYDNEDIGWIGPYDWSADGKWIAVQLRRRDRTAQIGLVSTGDGSLRVLKSVDWRGSTKMYFSPDSHYLVFDLPATNDSEERDVFVLAADGSREIPAVVHPADDIAMGWTPDGKHLLFASNRTGAMGVWALSFEGGKPQGRPQLIKSDIGWRRPWAMGVTRSSALYFTVRTEVSDVYIASIDFSSGKVLTAPVRPIQEFVGFNGQPDWSPDGKYLAYKSSRGNGANILAIRSLETGQTRELRPQNVSLNLARWAPDGRSFVAQGTDAKGRQGIYRVDAQTTEVSLLVQGPPGETSNQPQWGADGKSIFYHRGDLAGKEQAIVERDLASGTEREVLRRKAVIFGLSAAPDGRYLAFATSDQTSKESTLWVVPIAGGEPRELLRLQEPQAVVHNTAWTPDSRSILFVKNLSAAQEDQEYWVIPSAGGQPRKTDLHVPFALNVRVHPDGSHVVFQTDTREAEVWVMEKFLSILSASK